MCVVVLGNAGVRGRVRGRIVYDFIVAIMIECVTFNTMTLFVPVNGCCYVLEDLVGMNMFE